MPDELIAILVIIGSAALFVVSFVLSRRLITKEEHKLLNKCKKCENTLCKEKIKSHISNNTDMTPNDLIKFMNCEDKKNAKE